MKNRKTNHTQSHQTSKVKTSKNANLNKMSGSRKSSLAITWPYGRQREKCGPSDNLTCGNIDRLVRYLIN